MAGNATAVLFAAGLIGAGVLAVPVLTGSAAYAIAGLQRWQSGLDQSISGARRFYAVIAVSTVFAVAMNLVGIDPFRALFLSA